MTLTAELEILVDQLWIGRFKSEEAAFSSSKFRWLVKFCLERYCGPGTASEVAPRASGDPARDKFDADLQRSEMERFFKLVGAPWYKGEYSDAKTVAES